MARNHLVWCDKSVECLRDPGHEGACTDIKGRPALPEKQPSEGSEVEKWERASNAWKAAAFREKELLELANADIAALRSRAEKAEAEVEKLREEIGRWAATADAVEYVLENAGRLLGDAVNNRARERLAASQPKVKP